MEDKSDAPEGGDVQNEWTEHLEELRRRIIAVLVVFSAATLAAFMFSDSVAAFLMDPLSGLGVNLYTFAPAEKFMAYLHLAARTGALTTAPFFFVQTGAFVWPGLKRNERKYALAAIFVVPVLFISGAAMAYKLLSPVVLRFFLAFGASDSIQPLWGLREYLAMLSSLMISAGLLLQFPLALLLVIALGITTPGKVARFRPYIVLLIFILAGVCTPPDVISQVALGVPLYLLFELTLLIGRLIRG
jgi:sec-independent protein translocase protein TatC